MELVLGWQVHGLLEIGTSGCDFCKKDATALISKILWNDDGTVRHIRFVCAECVHSFNDYFSGNPILS